MELTIGVTGPRHLTPEQEFLARQDLAELLTVDTRLHVGDAAGLDALALGMAEQRGICTLRYRSEGRQPRQLQLRSKCMVAGVILGNGRLYAWPNKPCPPGLTLTSWKGSGTWGTIRYAVSRGVTVVIYPLINLEFPDWLASQQISIWKHI